MDLLQLQPLPTVDPTPESEHSVSRPPSAEMFLVHEDRSGDSISRTATLVRSSIAVTMADIYYLIRLPPRCVSIASHRLLRTHTRIPVTSRGYLDY